MICLSYLVAETSSSHADKAHGDIARLAVASAVTDWEGLTLDDAALLYIEGDKYFLGFGVAKSYELAFRRYVVSARLGFAKAYNMLGVLYENGYGVGKDVSSALHK